MASKKTCAKLWAWLLAAMMLVQLCAIPAQAAGQNDRTAGNSIIGETQIETVAPLYEDDEIVTVIVQLDKEPLLSYDEDAYTYDQGLTVTAKGEAILQSIDWQQEAVIQSVEELFPTDDVTVRYQYNLATNGIAMEIPYKDMEAISRLPGVECVYVAPVYTVDPMMDSAAEMEQVLAVWEDLGYHGEGMVIAVLDTGIDTDHPLFADAPEGARLTAQDVHNLRVNMNAQKATYISEKIPFAYNYPDGTTDVNHGGGSDHGTHVSGICAGNVGVNDIAYGVAPEAQIAVFKVLGSSGSGGTDDILAAVEDAVRLGVDVINMSLGSPAGFTSYGDMMPSYDETYANVEKAGIFLAIAAGNSYSLSYLNRWGGKSLTDNPDTGMMATPATMLASTTVASVNNAYIYTSAFRVGKVTYSYNDSAVSGEPAFADMESGAYDYVLIDGTGAPEDFEGKDVTGKIAVISRGAIAFTEKVRNAADAGACAAIIYNNEAGSFGMVVNDRKIPAISVTQQVGQVLIDAAENGVGTLETVEGLAQCQDPNGYQMSGFSSWGVTPDLRLEPDITAVGGNVYSSKDNGAYATMSGTSMATPNLAGGAALVRQAVLDNAYAFDGLSAYEKNLVANALMMSTAAPLVNEDGVYYSPRQQGSGLVQLKNAIQSTAYLTVDGMNRPKIELGDDPEKDGVYTLTFNIHNVGDTAVTYELSTAVLTESVLHSEELGLDFIAEQSYDLTDLTEITYSTGSTVKVSANSVKSVTVELKLSDEAKAYLDENFKNGIYVEGFVFLTPADGSDITLSLPYMGFYGDWTVPSAIDLGTYGDGVDSLSSQYENYALSMAYYWDEEGNLAGNSNFPFAFNPYWSMQDSETPDGVPFYAGRGSITNRQEVRDAQDQGIFCFAGTNVSLLRNVNALNFTIRNAETGEEYWNTVAPLCTKTYFNTSRGMCMPVVMSVVWYGTDAEGNYLPNNTKAELVIEAELDYTAHETNADQSWVIPITIDNEAPQLTGTRSYKGNGKSFMQLDVTDNQYLAYVLVKDGDEVLAEVPVGEYEPGVTTSVEVEVTGRETLQVTLADYACNEVTLEQAVIPAEDGVVVYPEAATIEAGQTYKIKTFNSTGKPLTFTSSNESVAVVDQQGIVTGISEGTARIYAQSVSATAICDITVTPASHTHDYQKTDEAYIGNHTVTVTYTCACGDSYTKDETVACPSAGYTDVKANWSHEYIDYVVYSGIMKGVDEEHFAPGAALTRGMLVTTLYRLAGEPEVAEKTTFQDVPDGRYFSRAVAWAQANGIVKGVTEDAFCPDALVTREQAATFLYRYATGYLGQAPVEGADLSVYQDAGDISGYAREAVAWATAGGLFQGFGDGTLQPKGTLTRAQMAKLLAVLMA